MSRRLLVVLALAVGAVVGFALSYITKSMPRSLSVSSFRVIAGPSRHLSRPGSIHLNRVERPPSPFKVIPAGKKFVLTDVMYLA